MYVQDLWPENVEIITGITNRYFIGAIGKMVDYIYARCDKIFATSNSFVHSIASRGVQEEKIAYWPQYAEDFYTPKEKSTVPEIPNDDIFNIIFAGNIGTAQGLEILPKTALFLKEKSLAKNIRFNIVGDGRYKNELIELVNASNVAEMFNFITRQPATRIPELLASNNAAFQCLTDNPLFSMTIPAKLQSYMACGIPIIASANGETSRILKESEAGLISPAGDARKLAEVIVEMLNKSPEQLKVMGLNAREYYNRNFNKQELLSEMDSYFGRETLMGDIQYVQG